MSNYPHATITTTKQSLSIGTSGHGHI